MFYLTATPKRKTRDLRLSEGLGTGAAIRDHGRASHFFTEAGATTAADAVRSIRYAGRAYEDLRIKVAACGCNPRGLASPPRRRTR